LAGQALAGQQLLAAFPNPMWLLDAYRFVLHANPQPKRRLQPRLLLRCRPGACFCAAAVRTKRWLSGCSSSLQAGTELDQ